eukprot:1965835-Rhodomonas_salina.2
MPILQQGHVVGLVQTLLSMTYMLRAYCPPKLHHSTISGQFIPESYTHTRANGCSRGRVDRRGGLNSPPCLLKDSVSVVCENSTRMSTIRAASIPQLPVLQYLVLSI